MKLLLITQDENIISETIKDLNTEHEIHIAKDFETVVTSLLNKEIDFMIIDCKNSKVKFNGVLKLLSSLVATPDLIIIDNWGSKEINMSLSLNISYLESWCVKEIKEKLKSKNHIGTMFDQIKINTQNMTAIFNNNEVQLTEIEFKILTIFIANPNKLISMQEITKFVWSSHIKCRNNFATHLTNLKSKLPLLKDLIINARGRGYYLIVE